MTKYKSLLRIASDWEAEFERNRQLHGVKIQCRRGCTDCCHHLFQITEIEAAFISHALKTMPIEKQEHLKQRAYKYLEDREKLLADRQVPDAWGSLPPPGLRLACPALEDGACQIYDHRPIICRKYGMPLYNPKRPEKIFACELNFQPGEEILDPQLVQIHTNLSHEAAEVQADYNRQGGRRDTQPLNVARAIVQDFEEYLPK
ncbi:MAG: YkgJ family cysteine cluster protein [Terriglobia bacterium]